MTERSGVGGGRRVLIVDDSVVRGTTSGQIVRMLREAGATEVHMRSASPEVVWPCFYGIDTATKDQLMSGSKAVGEVREYIGADSMAFLSTEGLMKCVPPCGYCRACFTGDYPVAIPRSFYEEKFLPGYEPRIAEPTSLAQQPATVEPTSAASQPAPVTRSAALEPTLIRPPPVGRGLAGRR